MSDELLTTPIDETAAQNLAASGFRFELLSPTGDTFPAWMQAVSRGFLDAAVVGEVIEARRASYAERRISALYDDTIEDAATPVATIDIWLMDLVVPGERILPAWAISAVTVAPTHRRRGIARNLLEAELRTAAKLGVSMAMLTVSEATIYGRFGFAPATMTADWSINKAHVTWTGRTPPGRVQLVALEQARDAGVGYDLVERSRIRTPGEVGFSGILWERLFGDPAKKEPSKLRVLRYDDEHGVPQGLAIYHPVGEEQIDITVNYLTAATDDAYAALWRYLFDLDLVDNIKAYLRPTDEAFRWQISDFRAATQNNVHEHLWLRILDVKATLEARLYSAPGTFVFDIDDDLGYTEGSWLLSVDGSGAGTVTKLEGDNGFGDNNRLGLSVNELGAAYLGGTSFATLIRAGRVTEKTPGAARAADAAFRSEVTPWLSIWF